MVWKMQSFEFLRQREGQFGTCHGFMGKEGLDTLDTSYMMCRNKFWGHVVIVLGFGLFEVIWCTKHDFESF